MSEEINYYEKRATIKDIASLAGTSKTTVSFYLNGKFDKMSHETKMKIEKVINDTGYSPSIAARSLTSKRSNLIGVIVGDLANPFSANIVKGIDCICRKEDFQMIVGSSGFSHKNELDYINRMVDMGVDGFIIQPTVNFADIIPLIEKSNKKIVLLDSVNEGFKGKWVKTDNYNVTKEAINELIDKGFKKIILITEDPSLLLARFERKKGFEAACVRRNINYIIKIIDDSTENKDLFNSIRDNIDLDNKTAIFCNNGKALKKAFDSIKEFDKDLFKKVGIIGYDNWDWTSYANPAVSCIEQPTYEEGEYAAKLLIDQINGENTMESKIFTSKIKWSESTEIF